MECNIYERNDRKVWYWDLRERYTKCIFNLGSWHVHCMRSSLGSRIEMLWWRSQEKTFEEKAPQIIPELCTTTSTSLCGFFGEHFKILVCLTSNLCCKTKNICQEIIIYGFKVSRMHENKSPSNFAYSTVVQAFKKKNKMREFRIVVQVNDAFRDHNCKPGSVYSSAWLDETDSSRWYGLICEVENKTFFNI